MHCCVSGFQIWLTAQYVVTSSPCFPHPSAATKGIDRISINNDAVTSFMMFLKFEESTVKRRINQTSYKLSQHSYLHNPNDWLRNLGVLIWRSAQIGMHQVHGNCLIYMVGRVVLCLKFHDFIERNEWSECRNINYPHFRQSKIVRLYHLSNPI